MVEVSYKLIKDLFKTTYDMFFSEEKDEFSKQDAMVLTFFSEVLNLFCAKFNKEIDKEREED